MIVLNGKNHIICDKTDVAGNKNNSIFASPFTTIF